MFALATSGVAKTGVAKYEVEGCADVAACFLGVFSATDFKVVEAAVLACLGILVVPEGVTPECLVAEKGELKYDPFPAGVFGDDFSAGVDVVDDVSDSKSCGNSTSGAEST